MSLFSGEAPVGVFEDNVSRVPPLEARESMATSRETQVSAVAAEALSSSQRREATTQARATTIHTQIIGLTDGMNRLGLNVENVDDALLSVGAARNSSPMAIASTGAFATEAASSLVIMMDSKEAAKESYQTGDKKGVISAGSSVVENASRLVTGSLGTAANLMEATHASGVDNLTSVLGSIASKGSITGYIVTSLIQNSVECSRFHAMRSIFSTNPDKTDEENKLEAFERLASAHDLTSEDKQKIADSVTKGKEPWYKKSTIDILVDRHFEGDKSIKKLLKKLMKTPSRLTEDEKVILGMALGPLRVNLSDEEKEIMLKSTNADEQTELLKKLHGLLFEIGLENEKINKRQALTSAFGSDLIKEVEKLDGSLQDIDTLKTEKIALVAKAKKQLKKSLIWSWINISCLILGVIGFCLAYKFSGGSFIFVELAISLTISAVLFGAKTYNLYKVLKNNKLSSKQKFLIISSAISSMALAIFSLIASKLLPIGLPLNIALISSWVCVGIYSIYTWIKMKDLAKQHLRQQAEQAQVSPVVPEEPLDSGNYSVVGSQFSSDPSFFSLSNFTF